MHAHWPRVLGTDAIASFIHTHKNAGRFWGQGLHENKPRAASGNRVPSCCGRGSPLHDGVLAGHTLARAQFKMKGAAAVSSCT
jgi:hypothetical protein